MDNMPLGLTPNPAPKKPESTGFFGGKKKEEPGVSAAGMTDIVAEVNSVSRRLRVLEDRYGNIRDKMQFLEQNQIGSQKSLTGELRATQADLLEVKRLLKDMDAKIMQMAAEVVSGAKKEDVMVLKRYIELWQPLNFVTRNQVEKIVQEIVDDKLQK